MSIGVVIDETTTIRDLLNRQATIMPSDHSTSNYCYLPYWFEVTNKNIIAWHLNQLPDRLKNQIESNR